MRGFGQQRLVQGKAAWLGLRRGASAGLELLDMGRAAMVPPLFCRSTSRFDSLVQTISMLRMQSCSDQHTRGYTWQATIVCRLTLLLRIDCAMRGILADFPKRAQRSNALVGLHAHQLLEASQLFVDRACAWCTCCLLDMTRWLLSGKATRSQSLCERSVGVAAAPMLLGTQVVLP